MVQYSLPSKERHSPGHCSKDIVFYFVYTVCVRLSQQLVLQVFLWFTDFLQFLYCRDAQHIHSTSSNLPQEVSISLVFLKSVVTLVSIVSSYCIKSRVFYRRL